MKVPCGLVPRPDLVYALSVACGGVLWFLLTSSAEKIREHVERIGMVSLTAFVGLQAFLCRILNTYAPEPQHIVTHFSMAIVYLPFLEACQRVWPANRVQNRTVESERTS